MKVEVRYFASLREALGGAEAVEVGEGSSVGALRDALAARGGRHAEVLGRQKAVRSARNRVLCAESAILGEGDEVGFFPPVTGGKKPTSSPSWSVADSAQSTRFRALRTARCRPSASA